MDVYDVIDADGVYQDKRGDSFQFKKGHLLAKGQIAADQLKKVGAFELITPEGKAETELKAEERAPENKAAPAPTPAAPAPAPTPAPAAKTDEEKP